LWRDGGDRQHCCMLSRLVRGSTTSSGSMLALLAFAVSACSGGSNATGSSESSGLGGSASTGGTHSSAGTTQPEGTGVGGRTAAGGSQAIGGNSNTNGTNFRTVLDANGASWTAWVTDNSWTPKIFSDKNLTQFTDFGTLTNTWLAAEYGNDWVE